MDEPVVRNPDLVGGDHGPDHPEYVLNEDGDGYDNVTGRRRTELDAALPVGISFWAGPGNKPLVLRVASAYEAATKHRRPPPDFGPVGR